MSSSGSRIILPLPVPSPHVPSVSRSSTSSGTYEPVPGPAVGPLPAAIGVAIVGPNIPTSQRLSPDSNAATRLPSITPGGILIEGELRDRSPPMGQAPIDSAASYVQDRLGLLPTSPTNHASLGGWSNERHGGSYADNRKRDADATTVLPWLKASEPTTVPN
jgi:hypothetical protein